MVRNIQLHHTGKYVCIVKSTLEILSAAADVIVRGKVQVGGHGSGYSLSAGHEGAKFLVPLKTWKRGQQQEFPLQHWTLAVDKA